ncbi:M24 family metallopeptidase [Patescibacteria group bacterium]
MNKAQQKSAEINVQAFYKVKRLLRVGMSEQEIAALVKRVLLGEGAAKLAFPVIAALGSNAADPHHKPGVRKARRGDMLVLDMGGVYQGFCSDMTRTLFFGQPKSVFRKWYAAVLEAQKRAYCGVRAGRTGESVDAIARRYLERQGLGRPFIHSLGHGVGKKVHQAPWVTSNIKKGANVLQSGNVITIEPGVYVKGRGGVRIEDMCEVLVDGGRWVVPQQRAISRMIMPN